MEDIISIAFYHEIERPGNIRLYADFFEEGKDKIHTLGALYYDSHPDIVVRSVAYMRVVELKSLNLEFPVMMEYADGYTKEQARELWRDMRSKGFDIE